MNTVDLSERIVAHRFMQSMPRRHIEMLASCAMEVSFAPGEVIFRQGDPANRFYLLESGRVEIAAMNGQSVHIQTIGAGDVLGWSWLFPPYKWQFDATALEQTRAIFLYGSRLRELCEVNTDLGFHLMKATTAILIDRLQSARRELVKKAVRSG